MREQVKDRFDEEVDAGLSTADGARIRLEEEQVAGWGVVERLRTRLELEQEADRRTVGGLTG